MAGVVSVMLPLALLMGFGLLADTVFERTLGSAGSDITVDNNVSSPDGEYVATTYTGMGGGAAGWCFRRVTVNKKDAPFSWENEKQRGGYSFNVSCGSEIEMIWEEPRKILVTYTGSDDWAGISVYQRSMSNDREVKIRYQPK